MVSADGTVVVVVGGRVVVVLVDVVVGGRVVVVLVDVVVTAAAASTSAVRSAPLHAPDVNTNASASAPPVLLDLHRPCVIRAPVSVVGAHVTER